MGYRSDGYFIIPIEYSEELERRVMKYLKEEENRRIVDKKKADQEGKYYAYAETKPWNPLTGFDFITLMEDSAGKQYYKYAIEGWKWYQGSGFPSIVSVLLADIEDDSKLAIFVLQGEDWDDTTVFDSSGQIEMVLQLDGNPWSDDIPQIFVMVNHEGTALDADNYQKIVDKLTALNPTDSGTPYDPTDVYLDSHDNASTTIYTPKYTGMAINAPTLIKRWSVRSEMLFYWDRDSIVLYNDIVYILNEFETTMADGAIGFAIMMNDNGYKDYSIPGTDIYEWDVYPNSGWDDRGLDLKEIKEIPLKDIHKMEA